MNARLIKIRTETKSELDRLMLERMKELKTLKYSYATFVDELVLCYKENFKR